ncbi:AbrB/MazE/SpoVT family DNA-binding domain-containing protein [Heyndrickxia ginsengihumi]|uniref:AbrB/MazE/SpoVT family DNA-binding domain-containing protein n=1 Tax=Heyndrickxia ginsengihumi TaxID=363870 RepID=UPI003D25DEBE
MVMVQKELERMSMPNRRPKKVKRISVSSKRQISIPKEFYETLNIGDEVNLELYQNQLVIRPIREGFDDFSEEILADLIEEGYSGADLMAEFKNRKAQLGNAVDSLIAETMAEGKITTVADLFGEDDDEL